MTAKSKPVSSRRTTRRKLSPVLTVAGYGSMLASIVDTIESARRASARAVNAVMTATYWLIGRRIVEYEQGGLGRAEYGEELLRRLADDLTRQIGRGFSKRNLEQMRLFYRSFPIAQTLSAQLETLATVQTPSAQSGSLQVRRARLAEPRLAAVAARFPLPWSAYVRLLSVENPHARRFYETEALRGGWSVRQLDRQIGSQFYERTALSRNKAAMLKKGGKRRPEDAVTAEEEIKDPYVLEFLGLRDEYSESDLEDALIRHMEAFLLELGGDFTFVARQRRLRIGDEWLRIDLLFYHRRLRCLVVIDLKLGRFTHADVGQMHLYLNYARQHWTHPDENPPVGLILCAQKDEALAQYALDGLPNKVLAAEYRTALPKEKLLVAEINRTRAALERRRTPRAKRSERQ
jgi:predicted nuclease of restriction endonuclease-like (RecB) superfamily